MPSCKIHAHQPKVSGWCQEPLSCGFTCSRLFLWIPHGLNRCPNHRDQAPPFFLRIPAELRLYIYRFLLPESHIQVQYGDSNLYRNLRNPATNHQGVYINILRVNRQIYYEAVALLYGTRTFTIQVCENRLKMYNLEGNNPALQDYQMQLMLLEQQNKRRVIIARQEHLGGNGESSSSHTDAARVVPQPSRSPAREKSGQIGLIWKSPLAERCFDLIQSFRVEVLFSSGPQFGRYPDYANDADYKHLETRLYDACDSLGSFVQRLHSLPLPITHLEIMIKFGNNITKREEIFSASKLLLQPFCRLRSVMEPKLLSITTVDIQDREIAIFAPGLISCTADKDFTDYLTCWSRDLCSSQPSPNYGPVFMAYRQLEKLVGTMKEHCHRTKFLDFEKMLLAARIPREANDMTGFREIWDDVVRHWFDYLNSQKVFQSTVASSIDGIYATLGKGA
jgi:hypothetical protein